MDIATARSLINLNNRFYASHASSFSATRSAPWEGWRTLSHLLAQRGWTGTGGEGAGGADGRRVLDLACGNLRFEQFLASEFPQLDLRFLAIDSCAELACDVPLDDLGCTYYQLDVLEALLGCDGSTPGLACPAGRIEPAGAPLPEEGPTCDLCACFGFMHHIPSANLRSQVLDYLIRRATPGGLIVVSFWQFMQDKRLARKAMRADAALHAQAARDAQHRQETPRTAAAPGACGAACGADAGLGATPQAVEGARAHKLDIDPASLDANDHFLGWQSDPSPLRYCHHFDESEIGELVASVGTRAREVARYSADGPSGTLNRYLVLERTA